ncbi:unnamed protein product [Auanema sp. JU1783]|nr:unnamed protein product [Auanema sp. JU1783]
MNYFFLFIVLGGIALGNCRIQESRLLTKRRVPSAFTLARLQKEYEDEEEEGKDSSKKRVDKSFRRDDVMSDSKCLEKCNNRLNIGMDMVNAHMAFGSIDVPSVVAPRDLDLFCHLDKQHSQCIDECGYSVQFNLREYVCRHRFNEMLDHQSCYSKAAPILIRHCRPRCGNYTPLKTSVQGYATRCRQLLCDHTCISFILKHVCGKEEGTEASEFLLEFTRLQVEYWIRDFAKSKNMLPSKAYPKSCARLQCDDFKLENCKTHNMG